MCVYHERLRVPILWWMLGLTAVVLLASEVVAVAIIAARAVAGFAWVIALSIYAVIGGGCAALLLSWGRVRVEVGGGELRAGAGRLSLAAVGEVAALNEAQTRALRGPRANPAAFMLMRPYLRRAVYVEVAGRDRAVPYWLVGTRHPAELAAAINSARPASQADGSLVG
jgi:hypothetical protein